MAWTSADVTALESAIRRGVKRVSYADHTVEYHSLDEMRRLLVEMRREAGQSGFTGAINYGTIR